MHGDFRIVDVDCHQMEPSDIWTAHMEPGFAARAPRLEQVGARRTLVVEGVPVTNEHGSYPMASSEFLAATARGLARFERARQARFDAKSRLDDMDEHGVDTQIIYPTAGGQLLGRVFLDVELLAACCRAYNRWSAEYCRAAPERLRWSAMLPLQSPELAIEEARRAAAQGCVSFYVRPNPVCGRNLDHPAYEPLWSALEDLDRPVSLHDSGSPHLPSFGSRMPTHTSGHILAHPFEAMAAMVSLIWGGVVERHPRLTIVHVEADAGWLPYWLQRMEQHYEFSGNAEHPDLKRAPTEYFKRSFFVGCRGDEPTLPALIELVGDGNVVFNTDYPHPDGTFPSGLRRIFEQPLSNDTLRKILWDNPARAFRLASGDAA
jgi:uncharacterized protein